MISKEDYRIVADKLGLCPKLVEKVYKQYWGVIKEIIESQPLKEDMTEEEFNNLKSCISIPRIGKFYCTYDKYKFLNTKFSSKNG